MTKEIALVYGIIYCATNLINGKKYIGKTSRSLKIRRKAHEKAKDNTHFHRAIQKYGKENFKWEIIDSSFSHDSLGEKEKVYIQMNGSYINTIGYNMTKGGDGGCGIKLLSLEQQHELYMKQAEKREITFYKKYGGYPSSKSSTHAPYVFPIKGKTYEEYYGVEEAKRKKVNLSNKNKGKDCSNYDYSNCHGNGGHKHTDFSKKKMSNSRTGRPYEDIHGENCTAVKIKQAKARTRNLKKAREELRGLRISILEMISLDMNIKFDYITSIYSISKGFVRTTLNYVNIYNFQKFKFEFCGEQENWTNLFLEKIEILKSMEF